MEAGTKYYTVLLKEQTGLIKLKKKLIRYKLRTEQLKQTRLQSELAKSMIPLPNMMGLSYSEESSSDEDGDEEQ